ncbi:MAG: DUF3575 domain-containing protein [Phocaeicola sp.]
MCIKRVKVFLFSLFFGMLCINSQVAIKTNLLLDAFRIPSLGLEIGLGQRVTLDLPVYYNPWKYSDQKEYKLLIAQPEIRYWFCDKFNGHFMGLHLLAGKYNVAGIKPPFALWDDMKEFRYKGDTYGAGITYGYQFILGHHWNLEASIGVGYAHVKYKKFPCADCGEMIEKSHKNYWGPTKANISLIYLF